MRSIFTVKSFSIMLALFLLPALVVQIYFRFFDVGFTLEHDESEHLHVIFALARGERPYIDFIENHPVLFHVFINKVSGLLKITEVIDIYWFCKVLIVFHFVGCLAIVALIFEFFSPYINIKGHPFSLIIIAMSLSGLWVGDMEFYELDSLWQLRPDWLCYFYTLTCLCLHFYYHWFLFRNKTQPSIWIIIAAAFCGGGATAILAKSIYLFLPYALLLISIFLNDSMPIFAWWRSCQKQIIKANFAFIVVASVSLVIFVWIELITSNVSMFEYVSANFTLNSIKHLILSFHDKNPVNVLRNIVGLKVLSSIALGLWTMYRLAAAQRNNNSVEYQIWFFLIIVVLVNIALPAYSNGLTWEHYFIPSLLAILFLLATAADSIIVFVFIFISRENINNKFPGVPAVIQKYSSLALPLISVVILFGMVFNKYNDAFDSVYNVRYSDKIYSLRVGDNRRDFLPERFMPSDLTYLVFAPQSKPANARSWGYFFMLGRDKNLWRDANRLGLAPDPAGYWKTLYAVQPPDVISLADKEEFASMKLILRSAQKINIEWLWTNIQRDYTCQNKNNLQVFVNNNLLPRFRREGWKTCPIILETGTE